MTAKWADISTAVARIQHATRTPTGHQRALLLRLRREWPELWAGLDTLHQHDTKENRP